MAKRKRGDDTENGGPASNGTTTAKAAKLDSLASIKPLDATVQIVAGSYERVLHGMTASLSGIGSPQPSVEFADSFLFNAHATAIRCLALSPLPQSQDGGAEAAGVYLATGGSDERVNVYSLSASPMTENERVPAVPTIGDNKISENPGNRELGAIMQHSSHVTALHFPTRSKLLSASEDNTINITRTRDLTVVSTVKAPRPKVLGQPSGDTAPPGATPAGINDFAIHPSLKLMISVGRGERSMRLWNLVTGKKAGVLNFDRAWLAAVKEAKHSSGEGRKIRWNLAGTEFAISFERGLIIFGEDAKVKCTVLPRPLTKVHQVAYVPGIANHSYLATSTEDGRIIFYDTSRHEPASEDALPSAQPVGQIRSRHDGRGVRIKDFKPLTLNSDEDAMLSVVVAASSDGCIRMWRLMQSEFQSSLAETEPIRDIGKLIGMYETGNRITCLDAFVMLPALDGEAGLSEFEGFTTEDEDDESSSDSDNSSNI